VLWEQEVGSSSLPTPTFFLKNENNYEKQTKLVTLITILALTLTPLALMSYSKKMQKNLDPEGVCSTTKLKKYMSSFGTLLAGMEFMKYKEKNPIGKPVC